MQYCRSDLRYEVDITISLLTDGLPRVRNCARLHRTYVGPLQEPRMTSCKCQPEMQHLREKYNLTRKLRLEQGLPVQTISRRDQREKWTPTIRGYVRDNISRVSSKYCDNKYFGNNFSNVFVMNLPCRYIAIL